MCLSPVLTSQAENRMSRRGAAAVGARSGRPLSIGGSPVEHGTVSMTRLTAVHRAIMRIVLMHDGQYGPYGIAAAMHRSLRPF